MAKTMDKPNFDTLGIVDYPGVIPIAEMRQHFEAVVRSTESLSKRLSLEMLGDHYATRETDTVWKGFAIGMRCAERIARARLEQQLEKAYRDHESEPEECQTCYGGGCDINGRDCPDCDGEGSV